MSRIAAIADSTAAFAPLPAGEAFSSGSLLMPAGPACTEILEADVWTADPVNIAFLAISLLSLLYLRRLVRVLPWLFRGMFSFRKLVGMQQSMRLVRERNSLTPLMCFCLCLLASGFGIYFPSYFQGLLPGMRTVCTMATVLLAVLLRLLFLSFLRPSLFLSEETLSVANHCANDFVILASAILIPLCPVLSLLGVAPLIIRMIAYCLMLLLFVLFLVRKGQFLSRGCKQVNTILYLCSLEILPVGVVALSAIFL